MDVIDLPFEFCALRFLLQWEKSEKSLHEQVAGTPSLDQIRSALRYFQVARTFKGLKSNEAAQAVADALIAVSEQPSLAPQERVDALANAFQERFAQFNRSAASKLLWLRYREPYIIYDSRAVVALKELGCKLRIKHSYAEYCAHWRTQYEQRKLAVEEAASRLPEARAFIPKWHGTDAELLALASQPWFIERVFDIYLWERGVSGRGDR